MDIKENMLLRKELELTISEKEKVILREIPDEDFWSERVGVHWNAWDGTLFFPKLMIEQAND